MSKHYWLVDPDMGEKRRVTARDMAHVREMAEAWLDDYERAITPVQETAWIAVDVQDLARDTLETVMRTVEPDEPDCDDDDGHAWGDAVVHGSGGGVEMVERCQHCRVRRVTDTWTTNPVTGTQGWHCVRYSTR